MIVILYLCKMLYNKLYLLTYLMAWLLSILLSCSLTTVQPDPSGQLGLGLGLGSTSCSLTVLRIISRSSEGSFSYFGPGLWNKVPDDQSVFPYLKENFKPFCFLRFSHD